MYYTILVASLSLSTKQLSLILFSHRHPSFSGFYNGSSPFSLSLFSSRIWCSCFPEKRLTHSGFVIACVTSILGRLHSFVVFPFCMKLFKLNNSHRLPFFKNQETLSATLNFFHCVCPQLIYMCLGI